MKLSFVVSCGFGVWFCLFEINKTLSSSVLIHWFHHVCSNYLPEAVFGNDTEFK